MTEALKLAAWLGILPGLVLHVLWQAILAHGTGWGDNAPDWNFRMRGIVFLDIRLSGLAGWMA